MKAEYIKKKNIPDKPGVYIFTGGRGKIFYIGKATSLRSRVRSYFLKDLLLTRGPVIEQMIEKARGLKWLVTDSVLEALILEERLIKEHQPPANAMQKDDKSFNYVVITKEEWPRVLIIREKDLKDNLKPKTYKLKASYGPFTSGGSLKEALKIVRKIFPFRDSCLPPGAPGSGKLSTISQQKMQLGEKVEKDKTLFADKKEKVKEIEAGKPCFNAQIGLCPGVCTGNISRADYAKTIRNISLFFEGKKSKIVSALKKDMKEYAKKQEFEKAGIIKKQLFALEHIRDVSLIKEDMREVHGATYRIEAYDIAHMSGGNMVGVMTVVDKGEAQRNEYRMFKIRGFTSSNDTGALREVLERRLAHSEWQYPRLIVMDGGKAQQNVAHKVLEESGAVIPIVAVTKDEYHRPKRILGDRRIVELHERDILLANHEAHRFAINFHRRRRGRIE